MMINVRDGEPVAKALRRFAKQVDRADIMGELRQRRHYVKPSEQRRLKRARAERSRLRAARKKKKET